MVKLQEVDAEYVNKVVVEDESFTDEEEEYEYDDELDNETLWERISALQDIIPAAQRRQVSNSVKSIYNFGANTVSFIGKAAWVISTTAFIVALPLVFELDRADSLSQAQPPAGLTQVSYLH
ncbi:hypothetical protein K502DRAFT_323078 [Neoconidiobolus thromboides FSU 785]|nr:hypothetical protein K502DRAFT_323078 [Neoconidiobolus thromboides FSU 785]